MLLDVATEMIYDVLSRRS